MTLTDEDALRVYAKTMNTLNIEPLENVLAENFHYSSQRVFSELTSKARRSSVPGQRFTLNWVPSSHMDDSSRASCSHKAVRSTW